MSSPVSSRSSRPTARKRASYEDDFVTWTQEQADLLRAAARTGGLPSGLDIDLIAEELESVGRAERNAATSLIRQIFVHVIKAAFATTVEPRFHWIEEVAVFLAQLQDVYQPSMAHRIALQDIWIQAKRIAEASLEAHGDRVQKAIPSECPYELQDLISADATYQTIRQKL